MGFYVALIVVVAAERLAELVVSRRNLAWARMRGGREVGFGHYPFMVVLHTGLLLACLGEAAHRAFIPALGWSMFAVVVLAQGLRWWCISILGPRWPARPVQRVSLSTARGLRFLGGLGTLAVFRPALLLRRRDALARRRAQDALATGWLRRRGRGRRNGFAFQRGLNLPDLFFDPLFLNLIAHQGHL